MQKPTSRTGNSPGIPHASAEAHIAIIKNPAGAEHVAASLVGVVKKYPGVLALDNASINIQRGEIRALLGKNGAGKSTLIRMFTGAEIPDSGVVYIGQESLSGSSMLRTKRSSEMGVSTVYQELSLVPDMNVAENMFMGRWPKSAGIINKRLMHKMAKGTLEALGFPIQTKVLVSSLSPAQRQLVEIGRAMMGEPRLLILDEPTSSLANEEVDLVFEAVQRIARKNVAILYVSHRMKEIQALASHATIMRDGRIIDTVDIAKTDISEIVKMMLGKVVEGNVLIPEKMQGAKVLEVCNVQLRPKLSGVSFSLNEGEVLGLAGLLGAGRTEILRIIAGIDSQDSGEIHLNGEAIEQMSYRERLALGICMTPENRKDDGIFPLLGVDENVVLCDWKQVSRTGVLNSRLVKERATETILRMNVKTASEQMAIRTLSGGNQQKIVIGRWIYAGSTILLLDEPTRGIDIEAKAQIYKLVRSIAEEGKSIVFVSSEIDELSSVCDRVLVLKNGRIDSEFRVPDIDAAKILSACLN